MKLEIETQCPKKDRFRFLSNLEVLMNEQEFEWSVTIGSFDRIIMKSGEKNAD